MSSDTIFTVAAVITALGVIFGGVYSVYRIVTRIGQALGVDREGRTLSERLERVEHQLWENGGSSLADRVNNIESHVLKTTAQVDFIKELIVSGTAPIPVVAEKPTRSRKKAS